MKRITFFLMSCLIACVAFAEESDLKMEMSEMSLTENVSAADQLYSDMLQTSPTFDASQNIEMMQEAAKKSAAESKYGTYTPLRELEFTTVPLVAFGLIAKADKKNFRAARNNFIPSYENRLDDWLQHVPLMAVFGMKLAGYESRNDWTRFLASGVMSYGFMALFTNGIKYTAKEMRPDGSTANSFPSGHTATAFVAATIMHKEYGQTRSPWWSVLGYTCATTTGIMRTLNNRHWISDVLVGAGIGVISTDLGYMMGDLIFKKNHVLREPLQGQADLMKHPSFFKVSLGMQYNSDLKLPTNAMFSTTARLWNKPGAATLQDDYYTIVRNGNPFRIPDSYDVDADKRTYSNYANSLPGNGDGSSIYKDPKVKVGTGTTVGAEAAYFFNKYVGAGARARITTAPVYAEGLSCYNTKNQLYAASNSVSEVWSIVDASIGVYGSLPINKRHNIGVKALYGRRFFSSLDLLAAYDMDFVNNVTGETGNVTMYGDNLYIGKTNADNFGFGLQYTYAMGNGMAVSAFFDYDFSKPEFDVQYSPYNTDGTKMMLTCSEFSYKQTINTYTIGASLVVMF